VAGREQLDGREPAAKCRACGQRRSCGQVRLRTEVGQLA
jgi:hypothetical protein